MHMKRHTATALPDAEQPEPYVPDSSRPSGRLVAGRIAFPWSFQAALAGWRPLEEADSLSR
jgi:hypothetical protein